MLLILLAGCGPLLVPLDDPDPPAAEPVPQFGELPAARFKVDCEGNADFDTIGAAIDAAAPGDVIDLAPCTYRENVDFGGVSVTLRGRGDPSEVVIDASSGYAVVANSGEGDGTALISLTVTGGRSGAIQADFSAITLEDVVLTGNSGSYLVYENSGDIELHRVTIDDNDVSRGGAVLYGSRGVILVDESYVACDGASYGGYFGHGSANVDESEFDCRGGYATWWEHAVGHFKRTVTEGSVVIVSEDDHYDDTLFVENSVVRGGISATYGTLVVQNSIVAGTVTLSQTYTSTRIEGSVLRDASCGITADTTDFTVRNNNFWGVTNPACNSLDPLLDYLVVDENLSGDPRFVDDDADDWHLAADSPLRDAGPDDDSYDDLDGSRNDIGVYGGYLSLDGGW